MLKRTEVFSSGQTAVWEWESTSYPISQRSERMQGQNSVANDNKERADGSETLAFGQSAGIYVFPYF